MYSLVLLTALSPGADITPAPAPVAFAPVAYGCSGIPSFGCAGSAVSYGCSGSCSGISYGCTGSCHGGHFGHGGMFGKHRHSCQGCAGYSCSGYNCFGSCHGSGWSCSGYSCSGWSCGGYTSLGSTWGPPIGMPPYTLHGYNQGGGYGYGPPVVAGTVYGSPSAVYGTVTHVNPNPAPTVVVTPAVETTVPDDKKVDDKKVDDKKVDDKKVDDKDKKSGGASLKFRLPADAKLFVDGRLTTLGGTERVFTTPPLARGQQFFYDVRAELTVDGKAVVEEKRVIVEAGADRTESFPKLFAALEGKGPTVAGK